MSSSGRVSEAASAVRSVCRSARGTIGMAEVALGVVGVVEAPIRHRRAGDRRMETVGSAQHGQGGQVAAEGPAADANAVEVHSRVLGRELVEGRDLIVEDGLCQVTPHRVLEVGSLAGCASAIGDHYRKALIGEPLGHAVSGARLDDALSMRSAVWVEQDRQRCVAVGSVGQDHCAAQTLVGPDAMEGDGDVDAGCL